MNDARFDALILTMPSRRDYFARLMSVLSPQLTVPGFNIRVRVSDDSFTLGENRNLLLRESPAEFIAFIDDDDLVPDDYAATILPLLSADVDYIGFDLQCYIDGIPLPRLTHHSLTYADWYEDATGYYRDISHVNPIRRTIALLEPFEGGHGEDKRWVDRLRARRVLLLSRERYIPRVMYSYLYRSNKHRAEPCSHCSSQSTVLVEAGSFCNRCGELFKVGETRKSGLWI